LKLVIFAKAQRTAVAANAKPLANLLARPAAVSLTNNARILRNNFSQQGLSHLAQNKSHVNKITPISLSFVASCYKG
jgi:hypothetical protein